MVFSGSQLGGEGKRRWIRVGLDDMEIEIRRVSPKERDRFRKRMIREGIQKDVEHFELNEGRFDAYCKALAAAFVTGWKNIELDGVVNPEYSTDKMGWILSESTLALDAVGKAMSEESAFFSSNGDGSTG